MFPERPITCVGFAANGSNWVTLQSILPLKAAVRHKTCSKLHKITKWAKRVGIQKALVLTLGGNPRESCFASTIRCLNCGKRVISRKFAINFTTKHSSWAQHMFEVLRNYKSTKKRAKCVKTPKVLVFRQRICYADKIRCSLCTVRIKSRQ